MIRQTVLHSALPMLPVIYLCIAVLDSAMMDNNPAPASRSYGEPLGPLAKLSRETNGALGVGVGATRQGHTCSREAFDEISPRVHRIHRLTTQAQRTGP